MSARSIWKGTLSISLVQIAVKLLSATEDPNDGIKFNQIHAECSAPIKQKRTCSKCNKELANEEVAKGYKHGDTYITVSDADLDTVRPESTHLISVDCMTPATSLNALQLDRAYYLAPDGPVAVKPYALMRSAMAKTKRVAVGKITMYGREHLVAIRAEGKGFVLHLLRTAAEIRAIDKMIDNYDALPEKVDAASERLATQLCENLAGEIDQDYVDEYRNGVIKIIQAKIEGTAIEMPKATEPVAVKEDVMAMLEASLATKKMAKAKPAKLALVERAEPKKAKKGKAA